MEVEKKGPRVEECSPDAVQGCGNPSCQICLPSGGGGGGGLFTQGSMSPLEELSRSIIRDTFQNFTIDFGKPTFRPASLRPTEAESAERAAREPVAKFLLKSEHQTNWSDIIGNEDAHAAMLEAIEFPIKHRDLYEFYGKRPTKGILLSGPPGCGKTMFGKAAATVIAKLHGKDASSLLSIKATELQLPYVGQTEKLIREIFVYAKAYKNLHGHQLVVFIDEADAILPSRDGNGTGRRALPWEESNVATFLTEMDGIEESAALVILATNRPHAIDTALLRDGRCDRKIIVKRPTEQAARQIFAKGFVSAPVIGDHVALIDYAMEEFFSPLRHLIKVRTDKGLDFLNLGHVVSGAMMVGLVERSKANAFHRDIAQGSKSGITQIDILKAIETVAEECRSMPDLYALQEFAQQLGADVLELKQAKAEIKYTGTLQ